jgi:phage baseplate assembly protein W
VDDDFIGRGWAYPMGTSQSGGIAMVTREQELVQAMQLVLGTAPGERPMRPEFGCRIHEYVFAEFNPTTRGEMIVAVNDALQRWEPRVEVVNVDIVQDGSDPALLYIEIGYKPAGTYDPRNLVFPFYTIPYGDE